MEALKPTNSLSKKVEELRKNLYKIVEQKLMNLNDPEVISASQALNAAIAKYNELLKKKFS